MARFLLNIVFLAFWTGFVSCGYVTFDNGRYQVKWSRKDDKIIFRVEVQTIGWVSFGFALQAPTGMRGYDVMMGGVENGKGYIGDYYTYGFGVPGKDPDQDFILTRFSERNGRTALEFVRSLKTGKGDTPDIQITEGKSVYFVWAYNSNGDRITQRHTRRGTSRVKYVLAKLSAKPAKPAPHVTQKPVPHVPHKPVPHVPQKPAPHVLHKPYVPPVPIDPRQNFVSFDGGKFLASWVYDAKAGTITFKLDVATTGWVSFGMAHKAPNKMQYYDVIIGGVMDDGYKYIYDYNTVGYRPPVLDIFQDYTMINASEINGRTLIEYQRKFRTEDIFYGDVQFWEGEKMALVWAYNSKNDSTGADTYDKHTNRGTSGNVKYDIAPKKRSQIPKGPSHQQYQKQLQAKKQKRQRRALLDDAKSNSASFDGGKYTVSWASDESSKKIRFKVEVQATGWVAFGFAKKAPNAMQDYDVVVGGVLASGQGYLYDYHTNGRNLPPRDAKQDYTLTGSSETNGKTTLIFERAYLTGDKDDAQFKVGNMVHLVWAYNSNGDSYGPDYFTPHTSRGWTNIKYDMVASVTKPTASPQIDVKVDPLSKKVIFDGGKFGVSWRYDSSEGKIHFDLEVRTTGWVGFGFAKRAPNQMKDYDVVVGGVLDSGQGYLYDYYTSGFGLPPLDRSQDYKLTSSSQKNGKTFIAFERKLKTGDQNDVQITAGDKFHLIWAYTENVDSFGPVSFSRHSSRGSSGLTYEVVAHDDVETSTSSSVTNPTTSPATVPASPSTTTTTTTTMHSASFDNGKFKVSWKFDPDEDKIVFRLDVQANGWVGFGFAKSAPNSMQDYDVIIGGALDSGLGYLYDYYTNGFSRPPLDASQDYKLIRAAQNNGKTTLEFERKRDTGDKNDVQFTEGVPMYMVWAYNAQDSFGPLSFLKHKDRGTSDLQYDIAVKEVTAEPSSTASLVSVASSLTTDWSSSVSPTKSSSSVFTTSSSSSISSSSSMSPTMSSLSVFTTSSGLSSSISSSSVSSPESRSTMLSTDSSSSMFSSDSTSSSSSAHASSTTTSSLSTQSSMSPTESSRSLQATTSTSSSSSTSASVIDTSSAWPESSTTTESASAQSPSASQTPLPSPTKKIPSTTTTVPQVSTPVNKEPAAPTPVVEASESKKIQIEEATVALSEIPGSESTPTIEIAPSAKPVVEIEEVPETKKEATNEMEKTVSPVVIAFEPDFDLRSRSSALWPSMLSICVAALVNHFIIL